MIGTAAGTCSTCGGFCKLRTCDDCSVQLTECMARAGTDMCSVAEDAGRTLLCDDCHFVYFLQESYDEEEQT